MKTDKQLYEIFSVAPELFFQLIGSVIPTGNYRFRSETVKEFSREMDGLLEPEDLSQPCLVVEFQFQEEQNIYARAIMETAGLSIQNPERTYYGIIIFRDQRVDPKTKPWASLATLDTPVLRVFYMDELLKNIEKQHPDHPLLAVFKPYLVNDVTRLKKRAHHWYNTIVQSDLHDAVKNKLCEVFVDWMMMRFKHSSRQEIFNMLALNTPLEETVAYKEIVAIGKIEGEIKGKIEGEIKGKIKGKIEGKIEGEIKGEIKGKTDEIRLLKKLVRQKSLKEKIAADQIRKIEAEITRLQKKLEKL